jgi:hypothetical protein
MEAPEVPTEHLHEHIHEHAHKNRVSWVMGVALSSALLAALAAVASLKAGHFANEAVMTQIEAANKQIQVANQWSYFQSKSIKESQLNGKIEIIETLGKELSTKDKEKSAEYKRDKEKIQQEAEKWQEEAKALQHKSGEFMHRHEIMAKAVTFFQVAIAVSAIAVLTRRRSFWFVSLAFGIVGVAFLVQGLLAR